MLWLGNMLTGGLLGEPGAVAPEQKLSLWADGAA